MEERLVDEWKKEMDLILESKVEEFKLMGYSRATSNDVWNCLKKKVWKGNPSKRVHEVVGDIFHLSSNIYMSYLTVQAYQDDDIMASIAALSGPVEEEG
ncbi:post-transcriptional regulator [Sediminibacillus halophilus]|uniref:Post-transcriptional regulator n=1 Tax=Sediminibacillus halophilus TaxID=482461 RepID=A0A1G9XSV6_9BACI|nr:post-transcriptional regulator [Sediminibacillus halophilus]SDM99496.1 Post-transcriptional regulator [Sediminibacillus halophilus]